MGSEVASMQGGRRFEVTTQENVRLDRWLSGQLPGFSRSRWQKAIRSGEVKVDGQKVSPREMLSTGRIVEIAASALSMEDDSEHPPEPQRLPLDVLWEDDDILVINKAPGMVVHPGNGCRDGTVANAALAHCGSLPNLGDPLRPGIVHRLDKETSGVLILAKSVRGGAGLFEQFKERNLEKEYLAVIQGVPLDDEGTCEGKIGRHPVRRTRMAVTEDGRPAVSHWTVMGASMADNWACVRVKIETGRTHQIRVHLSEAGFPLVGDPLYGYRKNRSGGLSRKAERVLLHAARLTFHHPVDERKLTVEASIPMDMQPFWEEVCGG
ncbi:RluA family pseudouridine synthase [Puniceicoccus vermicola]|uniref:Pseudouridine synthase n=1 Tax=Puniceicoccus vermicola TaxID=388746 RepID=A0A7X1E5M3_9BACT|nr:RluA family pseudouridine synthase [Puniceicoccus vermicola]